jgi:hypothetical protein
MNRYSVFFCFAFSVLAAGCVIPGAPGQVLSLAAEPDPVFYPAGSSIFDRAQNLTVRAFTSEGREIIIPPENYTMTFDGHPHVDHYSLYDIRAYKGTVEYMGQTVDFSIYSYEPGKPPDAPTIRHPI